eukprot:scaffold285_cov304-Pinguiococcus_pyrenoidosus.AAC.35
MQLRYRTTYSRVLDANRKFLDAATRYYDVSKASEGVDADDLLNLLGRAVSQNRERCRPKASAKQAKGEGRTPRHTRPLTRPPCAFSRLLAHA